MSAALLRRTLGHTDERAKAESELLGAMDVVKCATWEVRALPCFNVTTRWL